MKGGRKNVRKGGRMMDERFSKIGLSGVEGWSVLIFKLS